MNRDITARMTLSAVDKTAAAFKAVSGRLAQVERQTRAFNRSNAAVARGTSAAFAATSRFLGPAALAYGTAAAVKRFASVERSMTRIGITADASSKKTTEAFAQVERVANDMAVPVDRVVEGLDSLVASGRSLDEAMSFLPSVVATAQAAGAEVVDIATTADAVGQHLKITGQEMQTAFDIMAAAGKQGKFELKDMAQYLPSLAPQFARVGYQGEKGLRKLAASLQTVRNYTGSASEAATALENVLNKMGSEETAKKFAKMGVKDLRGQLDAARASGKDVLDTFIELTRQATKGDMSKLPLLFTDAQFLQGMNALVQGADATNSMAENLKNAAGTVKNDLATVLDDNQAKIDRMANSWDRLVTSLGGAVAGPMGSAMDSATSAIDKQSAIGRGKKKLGMGYWDTLGMSEAEINRIAFAGGWRSKEGALAETGKMALSPERRGGSGYGGIPVPSSRPSAAGSLADQYARYGLASQAMRGQAARTANRDMVGRVVGDNPYSGTNKFLIEAMADGGSKAAEEISSGSADAGQKLGDAATGALSGEAAAIGNAIGQAAASQIAQAVSGMMGQFANLARTKGGYSDARPMPGGRVNADVGRSGGDVATREKN